MAQIATRPLAQLCRRAGTALKAGLDARQVWQKEAERGGYTQRYYMSEVSRKVAAGESVADAMKACHGYFPPLVCAMVDIGERTGRLDEVFLRLAENYDHLLRLQRTFLIGIAWPMIELAGGILIVGLMIFILGMLGQTAMIGLPMSGTTALLLYVLFVGFMAAVIAVPVVAVLRGWLGPGPLWLATQVPFLGGALRTMALSRFAWSLAMAHESGMDARGSLRLALASTQNSYYTSHEESVDRRILMGGEMHEALRETGAFSTEFLDLLENGETSGQVSEQMIRLSNDYRERAQSSSGMIAVLSGAIIYGLVLVVGGAVAIWLFYNISIKPIYDLTEPQGMILWALARYW